MTEKKTIKRFGTGKILCYTMLMAISILVLYPIFLMVVNSVKDYSEFLINSLGLPNRYDFMSYYRAFMKAKFFYALPNSIYLTGLAVIILIGLGSMAAYPIARIKLKFNQLILRVFLAAMIVPCQVLVIPLFILLRKAGMINSLTALSLVLTASLLPLTIFVYTEFMKGIPKELEEAAIVDGCGSGKVFFRIIFPLAKPATVTVIILTSLDIWNNFFYPLIFLTQPEKLTLSVAVFAFKSFEIVRWPDMFAAMSMIVLPIIILYLILQRQLIKGMIAGAVKG